MDKDTSLLDKSKNIQEDRKNLSNTGKRKNTPEEFLLQKETSLGKVITPRFRELFFRKYKELNDLERAWSSIYGD